MWIVWINVANKKDDMQIVAQFFGEKLVNQSRECYSFHMRMKRRCELYWRRL